MPSQPKSPFASTFNSAVKRGVPAGQAVESIAKRQSKSRTQIFNSLHKAGICERQKINGQWIYWQSEKSKTSATHAKASQTEMWQNLVDWAIASGQCKPEQLSDNTGSQKDFMNYCRKYFSRQIGSGPSAGRSSSTTRSRATSPTARKRTATARKRSTSATARKRSTSATARKRTASATARKRSTSATARKRSTSTTARRKSTTSGASYKFPRASASRRTRRAA